MTKKKVGVITFHTPDNYGAVWQAYALQKYLIDRYNYNCEIIDYCTNGHLSVNNIYKSLKIFNIKSVISNILAFFERKSLMSRKCKFDDFRKKNLKVSRRYESLESLLTEIEPYDVYITGSDQVFHPESGCRSAYYMNWKKNGAKKIAYAPSFGISEFTSLHTQNIISYLNDFDALSCREQSGAEYLRSITGRDVQVVADPVFLLDKEQWADLLPCSIHPNSTGKGNQNKKYICVYDLNGGDNLIKIAERISRKTNMPIKCVSAIIKRDYFLYRSDYGAGPVDLIQQLMNAEYVVTDSFHGTALSLVFNKKVISYIAYKKGATRIVSLMDKMDLASQIVYDIKDFDFDKMNFNSYDDKLKTYIEISKKWLEEAII